MCRFFQVSRSGYYDFAHRLGRPEKDAALAEIIAEQRERSFRTYGYRRLWLVLKKRGIYRNPKTILRIMEKYGLLADIRRRRKWVNMGQQVHKYKNLLNRQFHADRPNSKWVTDISYIHTKQGVLYLSMIRDLYDNSIVAYKTIQSKQSIWYWIPFVWRCVKRIITTSKLVVMIAVENRRLSRRYRKSLSVQ